MNQKGVDYTVISVPKMNDSFSRIIIDKELFQLRFSYNYKPNCWKFGLYTSDFTPLYQDIKIVPGIPLNIPFSQKPYPSVWFGVKTKLNRVGYEDFWNGNASFFCMEV